MGLNVRLSVWSGYRNCPPSHSDVWKMSDLFTSSQVYSCLIILSWTVAEKDFWVIKVQLLTWTHSLKHTVHSHTHNHSSSHLSCIFFFCCYYAALIVLTIWPSRTDQWKQVRFLLSLLLSYCRQWARGRRQKTQSLFRGNVKELQCLERSGAFLLELLRHGCTKWRQ